MKKICFLLLVCSCLEIFTQDYKFGKVTKAELEETFYPTDSTADAAYLYKYRRSYFDYNQTSGFQLVTNIHQRIKIYTKEGFDYATKLITYYKPERGEAESVIKIKGYTYTLDNGKITKEKLTKSGIFKEQKNKYNSQYKITMPNLKEGCVVEFKYSIISPYATSVDDVEFQKGIPIKRLKSQLEFPEFYSFNKTLKGYYSVPMKESSKSNGMHNYNVKIFTFESDDIPALKNNEPFVANVNNYRGGMKIELASTNFISIGGRFRNYSSNWENVSKKIYQSKSFGDQISKTNYYKEELNTLLTKANTDTEKILTIFEFVKSKVKWNGFYGKYTEKGVRKAYKDRVGNVAEINLILTSMLRFAGLNANPVLVSSRGNGIPIFPTTNGFDYVISTIQFPDNSYVLLDATEPFSMPNLLPVRALNWNGRLVTEDGNSSWIKLTSSIRAEEENMIMAKVTEDLEVDGFVRTKYKNLNALNFRKNNNHIKQEDLIEKYEEKNSIEIEDFKISNSKDLTKPIVRTVKFISEDFVETINNKLYIEPLLFLTQHENPFKLDERKFPVDFATAWKDVNRISLELPEGYAVESLPEELAIALPDNLGVFKYKVQSTGKKISVYAVLEFNSSLIPANYYAQLKDFYGQLVKKETEKIVLIKT